MIAAIIVLLGAWQLLRILSWFARKLAPLALLLLLLAAAGHGHAASLALGDSLALGFGHASGLPTRARVGIGSCAIARLVPAQPLALALISAGTNDPPGFCIESIRSRVKARRVFWIAPVNGARAHVLSVASRHGDGVIFYVAARGRAWPHPSHYYNVFNTRR